MAHNSRQTRCEEKEGGAGGSDQRAKKIEGAALKQCLEGLVGFTFGLARLVIAFVSG